MILSIYNGVLLLSIKKEERLATVQNEINMYRCYNKRNKSDTTTYYMTSLIQSSVYTEVAQLLEAKTEQARARKY